MSLLAGGRAWAREDPAAMSRFSSLSPRARRAWGIGLIAWFVLLIAGIAVSQWYAENVNVPRYEAKMHAEQR